MTSIAQKITSEFKELAGGDYQTAMLYTALAIRTDRFSASVSSGSDIRISGVAGSADLSASSSGALDASGLKAGSVDADASSSGGLKAAVTGPGESRILASSSGDVILTSSGEGRFVVSATSGADVKLSGACRTVSVTASSGAGVANHGDGYKTSG